MIKRLAARRLAPYVTTAFMAMAGAGCGPREEAKAPEATAVLAKSSVPVITDETFETEVFRRRGWTLVNFTDSSCKPCLAIGPEIDRFARAHAGKVRVVQSEVEYGNNEVAGAYGVTQVPTLILFRDGREAGRHVGARPGGEPLTADKIGAFVDESVARHRAAAPLPPSIDMTAVGRPVEANDRSFWSEVTGAKGPVVVGFDTGACAPCEKMDLEALAYRETGKVKVVRMRLEDSFAVAAMMRVIDPDTWKASLPAMFLFRDGEYVAKLDHKLPWWKMVLVIERETGQLDAPPQAAPGKATRRQQATRGGRTAG